MRATEKGKAYGQITAKAYAVFAALLMGFHNAKTGRCFPSYTALQEAAGCCRATVAAYPLEAAGLLSVCNRLQRVRWKDEAALTMRVRVLRTSNCYSFPSTGAPRPAEPSEFNSPTGTRIQVSNLPLFAALDRLQRGLRGAKLQDRGQ